MTIGLQAYRQGYMHEKSAELTGFNKTTQELGDKLFGTLPAHAEPPMTEEEEKWWQRIQPVEKLSIEMDELIFQMRAMSPEERAVATQKHSELMEQRDMLEAQIYAKHGYEKLLKGSAR